MQSPGPSTAKNFKPLYRQLAEQLRLEIRQGGFIVGSTLPAVRDLAERFDVSPQTVRGALALLRDAGLVSSRRRGGTRVETPYVDRSGHLQQALHQMIAFSDNVRLKVTGKQTVIARTEVAELLQCTPGEAWFKVSGYRHLHDDPRPRIDVEVYINSRYPRVFERVSGRTTAIFVLFEELYGEAFVEFRQEVRSVRLADATIRMLSGSDQAVGLRYVNRFIGEFGETLQISTNTHLLNDPQAVFLRKGAMAPEV